MRGLDKRRGQITGEFARISAGVMMPLTFGLIFTAQILWIWHSVNELTRMGASYAATHCYQTGAGNVTSFMLTNLPAMPYQDQFLNGPVQIQVSYFSEDPTTGTLTPFACSGGTDCTTGCIPDVVTVSISGFQYQAFAGISPIVLPNFQTTLPIQGCGCYPETAPACMP
jgi:hypothetical protein